MKKKEQNSVEIKSELMRRYPDLESCEAEFEAAFFALLTCYRNGGKLLIAGNGGSASDSEHITGELMKSFLFNRKIDLEFQENMEAEFGKDGQELASQLEGGLPTIPLTSMSAISTAYANDVNGAATFAQLTQVLGRKGDVFLGISTSGNSKNIIYALMAAKARGMKRITLTGASGGRCIEHSDICIRVPEIETFKIQELHLPIYHALCAMLEAELFEERS